MRDGVKTRGTHFRERGKGAVGAWCTHLGQQGWIVCEEGEEGRPREHEQAAPLGAWLVGGGTSLAAEQQRHLAAAVVEETERVSRGRA